MLPRPSRKNSTTSTARRPIYSPDRYRNRKADVSAQATAMVAGTVDRKSKAGRGRS
jgi:hypothetical protein